jgi:enoyl-CoA hydratase/carnithine racemase
MVHLGQSAGFETLVLDSPLNRNAPSLQLLDELRERVLASASGPSRGLVLTHTGTAFCSGVDLRERRALGASDSAHSRLLGDLLTVLWKYPKPLVTVVAGAVRGGGMGLLACSDMVIATRHSTFAYPEVRVGVAPALVMAVTLSARPAHSILGSILTGAVFDAERAQALGLITTVDDHPVDDIVRRITTDLGAAALPAQRTAKLLFRAAQGVDIDRVIADAVVESSAQFRTTEAEERMTAFAERRPPP